MTNTCVGVQKDSEWPVLLAHRLFIELHPRELGELYSDRLGDEPRMNIQGRNWIQNIRPESLDDVVGVTKVFFMHPNHQKCVAIQNNCRDQRAQRTTILVPGATRAPGAGACSRQVPLPVIWTSRPA